MFTLLAEVSGSLEHDNMYNIYNPMGAVSLCGVIYFIICLLAVCPKGDMFGAELKGLIGVVIMWICFSLLFFFWRGDSSREVTRIEGKEFTRQEIANVYNCLMNRKLDVGGVEESKFDLIMKHLKTKQVERIPVEDLSAAEKLYDKKGYIDLKENGDVYLKWVLDENVTIGSRQPEDFTYYYKNVGHDHGVPRWIYHPAMWVMCPLISLLFSRPLWALIFINRLLDRS
jgi:hypothetical protein